jgi:hypothetical protein
MTPIEAAGTLYKIKQINDYLMSSFQVVKKSKVSLHYYIIHSENNINILHNCITHIAREEIHIAASQRLLSLSLS